MTPEEQLNATKMTLLSTEIERAGVTGTRAEQLTKLWAADFSVGTDAAGRYSLRDGSGASAGEVVKVRLGSPEWGHFRVSPTTAAAESTEAADAKAAALRQLQIDMLAGRSITPGASPGIGFGLRPNQG